MLAQPGFPISARASWKSCYPTKMTQASHNPPLAGPSVLVASLGVLFASLCFGVLPYFARGLTEQGMPPHVIAFHRFTLAAVVLSPLLIRHRHKARAILWGLGAGAAMGLGWIAYVAALRTAPVALVGVLYMTYPVFTLLIAWVLFQAKPSLRAIGAAGLIILAALVASGPATAGAGVLPALMLSLAAPLGFGLGITALVYRLTALPPLARIAAVSLGSVLGLLPLIVTSAPSSIVPQDDQGWLLLAGIALGTALIPQLIYSVCAPIAGAGQTAVIGSIELPTMFAVGLLAFGERISPGQITACLLILLAIVINSRDRPHAAPQG